MVMGLLLVVFGLLVVVYPQLLVGLISGILIGTGLVMCLISWRWRRMRRRSESAFVNWMIRPAGFASLREAKPGAPGMPGGMCAFAGFRPPA